MEGRLLEAGSYQRVSLASISYHIFDARLRLEQRDNDFARWLKEELNEAALAAQFRRLDPYTQTEDSLRRNLIALIDRRMAELAREHA